jgi:FAD/FMN-containing dehydrogenase
MLTSGTVFPFFTRTGIDPYFRSTTCHLPAASFIKVQNPIEVALALKIATHMQCSFAIRSAGHSANPGFASIGESGFVIDLSSLNTITLSETKDVASVGPGATWDKVYEALEKHELAVVGGRAPGVGVGGLITGGLSSLIL